MPQALQEGMAFDPETLGAKAPLPEGILETRRHAIGSSPPGSA